WEIGHINVSDQFWQYQKEIVKKTEIEGLKYENIYKLLALSSIIVLSWPYILSSLNEASFNHFLEKDAFMESGNSKLTYIIFLRCRYDSVMKIVPLKLSEEEYCLYFTRPLICDKWCTILNSEFKPLGSTPQRMKDRLKVQLKTQKSINQQLQSKEGPGEAVIFLNIGDLMEFYFMDLKHDDDDEEQNLSERIENLKIKLRKQYKILTATEYNRKCVVYEIR
ncbi:7076_t:CDS:2, partial [Funneliformis geosporum]